MAILDAPAYVQLYSDIKVHSFENRYLVSRRETHFEARISPIDRSSCVVIPDAPGHYQASRTIERERIYFYRLKEAST